jgi:hypothetical protein
MSSVLKRLLSVFTKAVDAATDLPLDDVANVEMQVQVELLVAYEIYNIEALVGLPFVRAEESVPLKVPQRD